MEIVNKFAETPSDVEAFKAATRYIESPVFQDTEHDWHLVNLIREGLVIYNYPDKFQMTQRGAQAYEQQAPLGEA